MPKKSFFRLLCILLTAAVLLTSGCKIVLDAPVEEPSPPSEPVSVSDSVKEDMNSLTNSSEEPERSDEPEQSSAPSVPDYHAAISVSDGSAVYWIFTDANGAFPAYMILDSWLDMRAESVSLPLSSDEIIVASIQSVDDDSPHEADFLPEEARGALLTGINGEAFSGCALLTSVIIPETVEFIGDNAFSCTSVEQINLPAQLTSLGAETFRDCASLSGIVIPEGVSLIPEGCFSGCSGLVSVELGNTSEIGADAFKDCTALQSFVLGDSLQYISYRAFSGCTGLEAVDLPASLLYIGSQAFEKTSLTQILLPDSLLELGSYAFRDCPLAVLPVIPVSLTAMGANPFADTPAIKSALKEREQVAVTGAYVFLIAYSGGSTAEVEDTVEVICSDCFRGLDIKTVTIPESVTRIGESAFRDCRKLETVTMSGVKTIDNYAFLMCTALKSCSFSDCLESIGYDAFWNCTALKELHLPESLTCIDTYAFDNCFNLTAVCSADSYASTRCCELNIPVRTQ